jgi:hypothetical protein
LRLKLAPASTWRENLFARFLGHWTMQRTLKSRDQRKRVEMRFAHLKTHHGFERMRLRGLSGARDEFHLAAIVQNLLSRGGSAARSGGM